MTPGTNVAIETRDAIAVSPRTVIDGCFDVHGTAELALVYDLGLAVGVTEQAVRLTIRRLEAAGLLTQIGRGRAGHLQRTEAGQRAAAAEARLLEFAFEQDEAFEQDTPEGTAHTDPDASHSASWWLFTFSIPEAQRTGRDALRRELTRLGAAALSPGTYLSPHPLHKVLRDTLSPELLRDRLVVAHVSALTIPGCASDADVAAHFWPAATTLAAYEPLEAALTAGGYRDPSPRTTPRQPDSTAATATAARALALAEALDHALRVDPLLPPQLLPRHWPPRQLRTEFARAWQALADEAPGHPLFVE